MQEPITTTRPKYSTLTVVLKGHEDSPLIYKDAEFINRVMSGATDAILIRCHVNLPVNEDKTEYKDYELMETIPYENILRFYTLDEQV